LKNLYDAVNVRTYAPSFSATVLRDEKALLTGRKRILAVMPLDFREFLDYQEYHHLICHFTHSQLILSG